MKKVFAIHGYSGYPNGAWRPWLMTELEKKGIYACALPMPGFDSPMCKKWVDEIKIHVEQDINDEIYLVGHSLGATSILRYLENETKGFTIAGSVLVSTPIEKTNNRDLDNFFEPEFDFGLINKNCKAFSIIHGDNDTFVSPIQAKRLSSALKCPLTNITNGGHLSGQEGWYTLPPCLELLMKMMK